MFSQPPAEWLMSSKALQRSGTWRCEEGVHGRVNVKYGRWKRGLKQWRA
ncbi:hypothetical protein F383_08855 [Gossypium arboreum]|uniref:Uncharacterized protein n=1 Tax=Gossypium arboreum TaxID=29729 RepID=A0A0B0PFG7_GOSAR|nr:hypothetical protein F383_08855 [Gossypium arboreum]